VFLTGQDDIEAALRLLNDEIQHLGKHYFGNSFFFCMFTILQVALEMDVWSFGKKVISLRE
jgi:hypothetical protein